MPVPLVTQLLDVRDYFSPLSILKVNSVLKTMKDGQILEVWSNDVETEIVLKQIIQNSDDELVGIEKEEGFGKMYIKRGVEKKSSTQRKKITNESCGTLTPELTYLKKS